METDNIDICILNYNGAKDTVACIKSIFEREPNLNCRILLYDNASRKEDVKLLVTELTKLDQKTKIVDICDIDPESMKQLDGYEIILFLGSDNIGFARANNWLLKYGMCGNASYFALLNNDTELVESSISNLLNAMNQCADQCDYASCDIRYYSDPELSWNAGGKMFLGTRRYNKNREILKYKNKNCYFPPVDYITGCFLLLPRRTLNNLGLLTESFFFGEEDYEYALRAKRESFIGRVLLTTHILHKVGASINRDKNTDDLSRSFVHRLNRFIDMKHYYKKPIWLVWRRVSSLYFYRELIFKYKLSLKDSSNYIKNLLTASTLLNSVGKEVFQNLSGKDNNLFIRPFTSNFIKLLLEAESMNS